VIACEQGAWRHRAELEAAGAHVLSTPCVGNLHSSVVEITIRGGARGVLVLSCPPRDCHSREGPKWLVERLFHDREAELQARVDRRRIAVGYARSGAPAAALEELRRFTASLDAFEPPPPMSGLEIEAICEPVLAEEEAR